MFYTLFFGTFLISIVTVTIVVGLFRNSIKAILSRIIKDDIYAAWSRYMLFALYVVGISAGVEIYKVEQYINRRFGEVAELNTESLILEIYRTVIGTLQGVAWMLLLFFCFALVAYVIVRAVELKHSRKKPAQTL